MRQVIDAALLAEKKEEAIAAIRKSNFFILATSNGDSFKTMAVADQYHLSLASVLFGNMAVQHNHFLTAEVETRIGQKYDG
jgi:hypothetical protein